MLQPRKKWIIAYPLGGDLIHRGADLGKRTKRHLTEAVLFAARSGRRGHIEIAMSPGHSLRDGKSHEFPLQKDDMAEMMLDWITEEHSYLGERAKIIGQNVWGTKRELQVLRAYVDELCRRGLDVEAHIFCSWWHKLRTWIDARRIIPEAHIHAVWGTFELRGMVEEPVKIVGELLRTEFPAFGTALRSLRGRD